MAKQTRRALAGTMSAGKGLGFDPFLCTGKGAECHGCSNCQPLDCSGAVADVFTDWRLVDEARREALSVAAWAFDTRQKTSRRRWLRRRWLRGVFREKHRQAAELKAELDRARDRGAWEPAPEPSIREARS